MAKRGADPRYQGPHSDVELAYKRMSLVTRNLDDKAREAHALMRRQIARPAGGLAPSAYLENWLTLDGIAGHAHKVLAFLAEQYRLEREGRVLMIPAPRDKTCERCNSRLPPRQRRYCLVCAAEVRREARIRQKRQWRERDPENARRVWREYRERKKKERQSA